MLELLERGAPPNNSNYYTTVQRGRTPLHEACFFNHPRSAKLLIKYGAIVAATDNYNITPLHDACNNKDRSSAQLLLEHGCPKGEPVCLSNDICI